MINYQAFLDHLASSEDFAQGLAPLIEKIPSIIESGLNEKRYGDLPRWKSALSALPELAVDQYQLDQAAITVIGETLSESEKEAFKQQLLELHPWRKGPFKLFDVDIDTEWRSDWKWDRLKDSIESLEGKKVLDIGCGSGYHCWRMRGAGAQLVLGIDPTPLFITQFFCLQKYIQDHAVTVLPMGIEQLPPKLNFFDAVFSMGVLYHRRSPMDHLLELKESLAPGGEMILETLVIDGKEGEVLIPEGRYARMGNVWFLPTTATLSSWLKKIGFSDIRVIDVTTTTVGEQRSTEWMSFHSLAQFLDPNDSEKTIEGYPAPKRAVLSAKR